LRKQSFNRVVDVGQESISGKLTNVELLGIKRLALELTITSTFGIY
jgi:hypothetical protein